MARTGKEPKPYTQKCRRGERPFSYSEQYGRWRKAVQLGLQSEIREAGGAWARRFPMHHAPRPIQEVR
jgi:hypothetical protein